MNYKEYVSIDIDINVLDDCYVQGNEPEGHVSWPSLNQLLYRENGLLDKQSQCKEISTCY